MVWFRKKDAERLEQGRSAFHKFRVYCARSKCSDTGNCVSSKTHNSVLMLDDINTLLSISILREYRRLDKTFNDLYNWNVCIKEDQGRLLLKN